MSIDGEALARGLKDRLLEAELLSYYENRKSEFKKPTGFPDEIFAGQPELTPPVVQSFAEVRPYLATSLADERAQSEIVAKFERLKNEVMIPFADKYLDQVDTIAEAKKSGETVSEVLPEPTNLKDLAAKEGLDHEITPLLDADKALPAAVEAAPEDLCWLFYTSGTTGKPKGAMWNHRMVRCVIMNYLADLHNIQPGEVVLHCAPLSHGSGIIALPAVARGAVNAITDTASCELAALLATMPARDREAVRLRYGLDGGAHSDQVFL